MEIVADKKGKDVLLLDIQEVSILADYFIIGSTSSTRQAKGIVKSIKQEVKEKFDLKPLHVEGEPASGWILMDYGDIMVHLFAPEARAYYDLEDLWQDGRIVVRML